MGQIVLKFDFLYAVVRTDLDTLITADAFIRIHHVGTFQNSENCIHRAFALAFAAAAAGQL